MSKFCGVISNNGKGIPNVSDNTVVSCVNNGNSNNSQFDFSQLENLTNWLIKETDSVAENFQRQSNCIQKRNSLLTNNEEKLIHISKIISALNNFVRNVELEVEINDAAIKDLENKFATVQRAMSLQKYPNSKCCKTDYLLELLEETDNMMMHLTDMMNEINEHEQERKKHEKFTMKSVFKFLDQHVQILEKIDKNLDCLLDKSQMVDKNLKIVKEEITRNNCTFHIEPMSVDNGDDTSED